MATIYRATFNLTGETYATPAVWEDATDIDLTAATTLVFGHNGIIGTVLDGDLVTGQDSGATATIASISSTQILLVAISGTFQNNEQIYFTENVNYVVSNTAGDSAIAELECHSDDGDYNGGSGTTLAGATTSSSNYRIITVHSSDRHSGTSASGFRIVVGVNPAVPITINESNAIVEWMVILNVGQSSAANRRCVAISTAAISNIFVRNIIGSVDNAGSGNGIGFNGANTTGTIYVLNSIIYNCKTTGITSSGLGGSRLYINCTVYSSVVGFSDGNGTGTCQNCLSIGNSTADYSVDTVTKSGSSDTTGSTGLQELVAATEFVDPTGSPPNFHLNAGATSVNAGDDYGTTPAGVQFDIDGRDRDAAGDVWDLGADEFVAAAGAARQRTLLGVGR